MCDVSSMWSRLVATDSLLLNHIDLSARVPHPSLTRTNVHNLFLRANKRLKRLDICYEALSFVIPTLELVNRQSGLCQQKACLCQQKTGPCQQKTGPCQQKAGLLNWKLYIWGHLSLKSNEFEDPSDKFVKEMKNKQIMSERECIERIFILNPEEIYLRTCAHIEVILRRMQFFIYRNISVHFQIDNGNNIKNINNDNNKNKCNIQVFLPQSKHIQYRYASFICQDNDHYKNVDKYPILDPSTVSCARSPYIPFIFPTSSFSSIAVSSSSSLPPSKSRRSRERLFIKSQKVKKTSVTSPTFEGIYRICICCKDTYCLACQYDWDFTNYHTPWMCSCAECGPENGHQEDCAWENPHTPCTLHCSMCHEHVWP